MDYKRYWSIIECVESGRNIEKINPPLTVGENKWFEFLKRDYEASRTINLDVKYVPTNDVDFKADVEEFNPDSEFWLKLFDKGLYGEKE